MYTKTTILCTTTLLLLTGCVGERNAPPPPPHDTKAIYHPMVVHKVPPKPKEEHWIEAESRKDIEAFEREQAQLSDLEKRERYRSR